MAVSKVLLAKQTFKSGITYTFSLRTKQMKPVKTSIRANQEQLALQEDENSSTPQEEKEREYFERLERKYDVARELRGY